MKKLTQFVIKTIINKSIVHTNWIYETYMCSKSKDYFNFEINALVGNKTYK